MEETQSFKKTNEFWKYLLNCWDMKINFGERIKNPKQQMYFSINYCLRFLIKYGKKLFI